MRHGSNFNPEWGYVAPAPGFMQTARLIVIAVIIGATAGAAIVFSLLDRREPKGRLQRVHWLRQTPHGR